MRPRPSPPRPEWRTRPDRLPACPADFLVRALAGIGGRSEGSAPVCPLASRGTGNSNSNSDSNSTSGLAVFPALPARAEAPRQARLPPLLAAESLVSDACARTDDPRWPQTRVSQIRVGGSGSGLKDV